MQKYALFKNSNVIIVTKSEISKINKRKQSPQGGRTHYKCFKVSIRINKHK